MKVRKKKRTNEDEEEPEHGAAARACRVCILIVYHYCSPHGDAPRSQQQSTQQLLYPIHPPIYHPTYLPIYSLPDKCTASTHHTVSAISAMILRPPSDHHYHYHQRSRFTHPPSGPPVRTAHIPPHISTFYTHTSSLQLYAAPPTLAFSILPPTKDNPHQRGSPRLLLTQQATTAVPVRVSLRAYFSLPVAHIALLCRLGYLGSW